MEGRIGKSTDSQLSPHSHGLLRNHGYILGCLVALGSAEGSSGQAYSHLSWWLGPGASQTLEKLWNWWQGQNVACPPRFNHFVESPNSIVHSESSEPPVFWCGPIGSLCSHVPHYRRV